MDIIKITEKIGRKYVPTSLTKVGKKAIALPRFMIQRNKAHKDFHFYKDRYPQNVLFVAGLPKSGTTWLEKMLCTLDGFSEVMIPEAVYYDLDKGGSHDFDFSETVFDRLKETLSVLKLHSHGSYHNYRILKDKDVKFTVIYRDLRDVAISYVFYVKRTSYHPEHNKYKDLTIKESLVLFGEELLPVYVEWVESWYAYDKDPSCLILKYEDLKGDTFNKMKSVFEHYGIQITDDKVRYVIDVNNFKKLSGGRNSGKSSGQSFFRKGISGDWKNYFNHNIKELYKNKLGDFLIRHDYEKNHNW